MGLTDICMLPRAEGTCTEKQSQWYFDQSENRCMPFYYTGCGGNKNNFESRDVCESDCPPKIGKISRTSFSPITSFSTSNSINVEKALLFFEHFFFLSRT